MNKSFSKIRHIQEANQRLEKRLVNEQAPMDFKMDLDKEIHNTKKRQIKDIIDNFDSIGDCEEISHFNEFEMMRSRPERDVLYCLYYKGKSKEDMIDYYKSL